MWAGLDQKIRHDGGCGTKLAINRHFRALIGHADTDNQRQIGGMSRRVQNLVEFVLAIENESAHTELIIGARNIAP